MEKFIEYIQAFSEFIPIEWFVFLGGIVEEILAPIPSPVVMTFAGSSLPIDTTSVYYLFWIGCLGALGKTIGSIVLYIIGYKLEFVFIEKYGNYFGLSKKLFDEYSTKINNLKWGVFWVALIRSLPFVPSAPFSGMFGILKYNFINFTIGTLIGNIIRDTFYVVLGFYSIKNLDSLLNGIHRFDKVLTLAGLAICLILLYKLRKGFTKTHIR